MLQSMNLKLYGHASLELNGCALFFAYEELTVRVTRPTDYIFFISFNSDTIFRFLVEVRLGYIQKRIVCASQLINMDEKSFRIGRNLSGTQNVHVITAASNLSVVLCAYFWYMH